MGGPQMKKHVFHPLWVTIGLVALLLVSRIIFVPDDFGTHGRDFTYGYHRLANVEEWQAFPVKYRGEAACVECHEANVQANNSSSHANIHCGNCHGPGAGHPDDIEALPIDDSRELCLRCHQQFDYPHSARSSIPTIDGGKHKRRRACSKCHDPHQPGEDDA